MLSYVRCKTGDKPPSNAIQGGYNNGPFYHARGLVSGKTIPGMVGVRSEDDHHLVEACIPHGLLNHRLNSFEVLTVDGGQSEVSYVRCRKGDPLPDNAIEGGAGGSPKYYARGEVKGKVIPGNVGVQGTSPALYLKKACIPYGLRKHSIEDFEVLVSSADKISHVEFHLDRGKILTTKPKVLAVQELWNESSLPQSKEFSFSETVSNTSTFTREWGFEISAEASFSCGLPFIAEGEISLEASASVSHSLEKSETFEKTHSGTYPVQAGPYTKVKCRVVANETKLEVPYTIHFKSGKTSGGMWSGVSTWDVKTSFKEVKLSQDNVTKTSTTSTSAPATAPSAPCNDLFAVTDGGEFYKGTPPEGASASWMTSASQIGTTGWDKFSHLFFHPDGSLYGVVNDNFYTAPPPRGSSADQWISQAKLLGHGGWDSFQFLFFDPDGVLYAVKEGRFYKRLPPSDGHDHWLGSATLIGAAGWSDFNFLFFDPKGVLYAVENGKCHKGKPPNDRNEAWMGSSTLIDGERWSDFRNLFFTANGDLYGVFGDRFFKKTPPIGWLAYESNMIGHSGWSMFKFLMSPMGHK